MEQKEYLFNIEDPEKYPYGYEIVIHKIRTGMIYQEFIPNLPPEGSWIRNGPFIDSKIIKITRID
jgi:hypothetical protein